MSSTYYNENDPYAAEWLRRLIAAGYVAPGYVDERDIRDVAPTDLSGFAQCHFFAGIGGWSLALRLAGWPDDRPVWTGSAPCQPFSAAGAQAGFADERHLWPDWFWLIDQCLPAVILGEQVAGKAVLPWLDLIQADLETAGYAFGVLDLCAAGVGAPHIRQRLYFVADALSAGWPERRTGAGGGQAAWRSELGGLADADNSEWGTDMARWNIGNRPPPGRIQGDSEHRASCDAGGLADADGGNAEAARIQRGRQHGQRPPDGGVDQGDQWTGPTNGLWRDADWLFCRDGKWRPVEPGTFPLAHGIPARVGQLRAYGNAIVPPLAAEFTAVVMEGLRSNWGRE